MDRAKTGTRKNCKGDAKYRNNAKLLRDRKRCTEMPFSQHALLLYTDIAQLQDFENRSQEHKKFRSDSTPLPRFVVHLRKPPQYWHR